MVQVLMGGTSAMRTAGKSYLPKNLNEEDEDYSDRLAQATLAPFFNKTLSNLNGRIFAKPIALDNDVPNNVRDWCENIDRQGKSVTIFWSGVSRKAIAKGSVGILVDYPRVNEARTLADERQTGARPYLTLYPAESILNVRYDASGKLTEARLIETVTEPKDEFDEIEIRHIRRLLRVENQTKYEIWRENVQGEWVKVDEGVMTIDEIPFILICLNPQDVDYDSPPPLLDLAYLCVKHWQAQSAQDNVADVARFPILAASGWDKDTDPDIAIGPRRMLATTEPSGRYYYVEHSGNAIAAGRAELERLEDQIAMEGTRPLTKARTANGATATQINSEDQMIKSEVQVWGEKIKDSIENSLLLMAKWAGLGEDAGGSVTLVGDFDFAETDSPTLAALHQMRASGDLSRQTLWAEYKRRGILSDGFDAEVEDVRLAEEGLDVMANSRGDEGNA